MKTRHFALVLASIALAACDDGPTGEYGAQAHFSSDVAEQGRLEWQSSYGQTLDGIYLPDKLDWAVAGINTWTCQMSYSVGSIDADVDITDGADAVFDGWTVDGHVFVAVNDGSDFTHFVDYPNGGDVGGFSGGGVVLGVKMSDAGPVSLSENDVCAVEWTASRGVQRVAVPDGFCDGGADMEIERSTGTIWLAGQPGVVRVDRSGWTAFEGTDVAVDEAAGLVYVGDGNFVRGLSLDGVVAFETKVAAEVTDVASLAGGVVVGTDGSPGASVITLDTSGRVQSDQSLAIEPTSIAAAADGHAVAIGMHGRTDFFLVGEPDVQP